MGSSEQIPPPAVEEGPQQQPQPLKPVTAAGRDTLTETAVSEKAAIAVTTAPLNATNKSVSNHSSASVSSNNTSKSVSRFLVVFHCVSAGLNGPGLGSDEEEIVFIVFIILDAKEKKVRVQNLVAETT